MSAPWYTVSARTSAGPYWMVSPLPSEDHGAPYNDRAGSAAGAAYLFRGEDPPGSAPAAVFTGESDNAQFGWSVAGAGDTDGDGRPDLVVGARFQASGLNDAAGRVYLYRGTSMVSTTPAAFADGPAADDWLGNAVGDAGGYFTPGLSAVMAGAPLNDRNAGAAGATLMLGRAPVLDAGAGAPAAAAFRAWPNPASRTIAMSVSGVQGQASAGDVWDVAGRRVAHLDFAPAGPGQVRAVWDLRDRTGRKVSAGLYFVRLRGGATSAPGNVGRIVVVE